MANIKSVWGPCHGRLVAGLLPRRPGFESESAYMGFVMGKVTPGHVYLRVNRFQGSFTFRTDVLYTSVRV
jgi:hypothetical protein